MPYAVGLTGGIGSGKSTVADLFAALGAGIVDTDVISHALTAPDGAALPAIRRRFGDAAIGPDGAMNRARMRTLVFDDPGARRDLEGILHPLIRAETRRQADAQATAYVIVVIPLLVESARPHDVVRRVAVVDCEPAIQLERVMKRSGLAREQVQAIMASQASREQRLAVADDVIRNDGDLARLESQVAPLHELYGRLALGT